MLYLRLQREKPAESKFCFLKLPIVFGYAVPFTAISKKQNRKGSPQSLIYPLKSKLTSFVIKQFFAFGREHQNLMRSRLRRFCSIHSVPSAKLRRVRKKVSICSHNNYIPHLLRMTRSQKPCANLASHPMFQKRPKPFLTSAKRYNAYI